MNRNFLSLQHLFISLLVITFSAKAQPPVLTVNRELPCGLGSLVTGILYGNGTYLTSVSGSGPTNLFTSANAADWKQVPLSFVPPQPMAFGGGLFILAGDSGKIYTSPDALTWTRQVSGTTTHLNDVGYYNGAFYAVGDSAVLLHSADGMNWDAVNTGGIPGPDTYRSIVYGNGVFVIQSNRNPNSDLLLTSADGTSGSWAGGRENYFNPGTMRFLHGWFYLFDGYSVYRSTDGYVTYQALGFIAGSAVTPPYDGYADSVGTYLVGSYTGPGYMITVLYTVASDGTFTTRAGPNILANGGAWLNHRYFMYGYNGLQISDDNAFYKVLGGNYSGMAYNGSIYAAVGGITPGIITQGIMGSSTDGLHWTDRTPSSAPKDVLPSVYYDGTKFITAGYSSVDAISWSPDASLEYSPNTAYGAGITVNDGTISTDHPFAQHPNVADYSIRRIRYVNGNFVVLATTTNVDTAPLAAFSPDGSHWTEISSYLAPWLVAANDIVSDGTKYYFVGVARDSSGNWEFRSLATASLTDSASYGNVGRLSSPPPNTQLVYNETFGYSNGHFAGGVMDSSNKSWLVYSTDGIHWSDTTLNAYTGIVTVMASGGIFHMLGTRNVSVLADFTGVPLALVLVQLNAVVQDNTSVALDWKTGTTDNNYFTVQRSRNGVNWDSIGMVNRAEGKEDYNFVDGSPFSGNDYYRLAIVGRDGGRQLSMVKHVYISTGKGLRIYPNPAGDHVLVGLPDAAATVALYDASGALVYKQELGADGIGSTISVSLRGLPAGLYQLVVRQRDGSQQRQQVAHY
ncbi:MAG TPA: T9SS type A sorting domain-containing protein [Puia sp.]|nr:T9SS type A sorting domain-containing protein [Puia sp.]